LLTPFAYVWSFGPCRTVSELDALRRLGGATIQDKGLRSDPWPLAFLFQAACHTPATFLRPNPTNPVTKLRLGRLESTALAYAQMRSMRIVRTGLLAEPLGLNRKQESELLERFQGGDYRASG